MTIDISKRSSGAAGLAVVEQIDRRGVWRVRTDMQPDHDAETGEERGVTFVEHEWPYKPSLQEVKEFVLGVINAQTDAKILEGFQWTPEGAEEAVGVWLSEENQRNFAEAQRIAVMMPEAILPVTFKLGEDGEGRPVYHEFQTAEELTGFYLSAVAYINQCLADGWRRKDGFDFADYEEALKVEG